MPGVSKTTVINVKVEKDWRRMVYVGRRSPGYRLSESKWANPYKASEYGREEALRLYEIHLRERYADTYHPPAAPDFLFADLAELRGKRLGCWCHPQACHADLLAKLADMTVEEIREWWAKGIPKAKQVQMELF